MIKRFGKYIWKVFIGSDVPVWFLILSAILTAAATSYLAPIINSNFEENRVRSELVLERAKDINSGNQSLFEDLQYLFDQSRRPENLGERELIDKDKLNEILPRFSSLQWRAIELDQISKTELMKNKINAYQDSLLKLKNKLEPIEFYSELDALRPELVNFAKASNELNKILYKLDF